MRIKKGKNDKRVLVVSDFHCGHELGLTPPEKNIGDDMVEYRAYMWDAFAQAVDTLRPIHTVVANGDLIDGRGERNGSLEVIVLDRILQAQMAARILRFIDAEHVFITRGTDYHSGPIEDWEDVVAMGLPVDRVGDVINVVVNGLTMNFRHHIGGSQTPIGRTTPLAREGVWNELWHIRKGFLLADVIVRSHVHYHAYAGIPGQLIMTTPGLQGYGTRYGERRLSGLIDFGFVYFDVTEKDNYRWTPVIFPFPTIEPSVV